jgi:hypothetical protein
MVAAAGTRGEVEQPDFSAAMARTDRIVGHSAASDLVAAFFDQDGPFDGELVHTLPCNLSNEITLQDLYAITLLDVKVWPRGVRSLLYDADVREEIGTLLEAVPVDEDIWEGTTDFGRTAPAYLLWGRLQSFSGVAEVTASKILCRKRPRLLPIVDTVVTEMVNAPRLTYWTFFRTYLADDDRRKSVEQLRPKGLDRRVPTLRLLDVAIWMTGSNGQAAKNVRSRLGIVGRSL